MATILPTKIKTLFHSLRFRVVVSYLLIIIIAFGAVGFSLIQLVGEYLLNQRIREDLRIAEATASQLDDLMEQNNVSDIRSIIIDACENESDRMLVLDTDGVVQVDTDSNLTGTDFVVDEVSALRDGAANAHGFYDSGRDSNFHLHAILSFHENLQSVHALYAVKIGGSSASGFLVYITSIQDIYLSLRSIQMQILIALILMALIVLVISSLIMRSFTGPLGELNEGIRRMSTGELSSRIEIHGQNEITEVAIAFNKMSEKLEELDNSRSRFVSNASHELKTPLSTMKILIESLVYQDPLDPGMAKEFLGDINREIDRLNQIVSDLLTLSNIDSGSMKMTLTLLNLNALMSDQVRRLLPLARENGIEINFEAGDDISLMGDQIKLQQVFYNVIDNAIKYTPRGGEVETSVVKNGRNAVIRISDTGIGIPPKDLEHIFDRFYRVDKARSRATGGTGLGLSIVKQIVLQHGGTITAQSMEGKGTTFEIVLPINKA